MRFAAALSLTLVLSTLILAGSALATPTDFNFKDVELQCVLQTIAVLGRFNVILCPGAEHSKVSVAVRQIEPLDMLFDVAKQSGLQVVRVRHEEGSTSTTFMVGPPAQMQSAFGKRTRTIQLKYASAAQIARTLGERIEGLTGSKTTIDERTNRIILSTGDDGYSEVMNIIRDVDLPVPATTVTLTLVGGTKDKPRTIWTGHAVATQGKPAKIEVSLASKEKSADWRLTSLDGKAFCRINSEDFIGLELNVGATLEKNGVASGVRWATEVQVRGSDEVTIGTLEVAPGDTITLKAKPVVIGSATPTPCDGAGDNQADLDHKTDLEMNGELPPLPAPSLAAPASPAPVRGGDLDLEGI